MAKMKEIKGKGWYFDTKVVLSDGSYKRCSGQWYATKKEAQAAFLEKQANIIEQNNFEAGDQPFEDFIEDFEDYRRHTVRATTVHTSDEYIIPKHFTPWFGGHSVSKAFESGNVAKWYSHLSSDTKLSNNRKNKIVTLFKTILKFAYDNLKIDPRTFQVDSVRCYSFKESNNDHKEIVVWNEAELQAFVSALKEGTTDEVMFKLFVASAPRIGEFLALTPDDFDYEEKKISINKQVVYDSVGTCKITDILKTHNSYRDIYLTDDVCELLKRYIEEMGLSKGQYLFSGKTDHRMPLSRHCFRSKMAYYIKLAGIRKCNPHAIRHLLVVRLQNECKTASDIQAMAAMLGHDPSVSMNIYGKAKQENIARNLINKIGKA